MKRSTYTGIFWALLFVTSFSFAQITSGNLAGTVQDATGAVIPHAAITVVNEDTKVSYRDVSNGAGDYHLANLPSGVYDVTASASGFTTFVLKGLHVDLNKTSTANLALSVSSSQSVEVSADAGVVLDTTTTNLSQVFDTQTLATLPISSSGNLGVLNTSLLSPGVASNGGVGIGTGPSVGGQRPRNNNFTIEGIDNNDKAVTGPLVYVPQEAVGNFTLITNQFSPEFGHSSGGQFNTTVISGTNKFHGLVYENFQNRNLNAAVGPQGGKIPNPRFDFNRYGAELGGPILRDKLFFFANYERQTTGQSQTGYLCTPTAAGLTQLNSYASSFDATNLQEYIKYMPAANITGAGGTAIDAANDLACGNSTSGPQTLQVTANEGTQNIPLGNYLVKAPYFTNFDALTTSVDYNISPRDSIRGRYIYNTEVTTDILAALPTFYTPEPYKYHLIALSEFHTFTPNLVNEFRVGYNRYVNDLTDGSFKFPGLDQFPNLYFYDQGFLDVGPDDNAPQFTIQNLYQVTDNISYTKGKHTIKIGFDGRKFISPQGFTQRARGDYEWSHLDDYLHDLAPDANGFGERSTGSQTYYGDQTALYGYANDTWRVAQTLTLNLGLRYEFTSVPVGERAQSLNSAASVPGLINFSSPQPQYKNFAPRVGINWAPDSKTSVRAGFGLAYDVLFDNLGTLSFPPQYSTTNDVGTNPAYPFSSPNFLANGGLPPGTGSGVTEFCLTGTGGTTGVPCSPDIPSQRAATSAYLPNAKAPYAETYTLTVQRTIGTGLTAELGYVGTRGIHLPTQIQLNVQAPVTASNQLFTTVNGATTLVPAGGNNTLATLQSISNIIPAYNTAGFTSKITSYQPWSVSNYNGLIANLQGRLHNGLQMNLSYTWSKTMDDATAEVFATVLTPRRPQDSQNLRKDYSRSALDRTHRITLQSTYDVPFFKNSGFIKRDLVGNWTVSGIYTYESPEYATALSGVNSNLNGDSGSAIDRPMINPNGVKGTGTGVVPVVNASLVSTCDPTDSGTAVNGAANGTGGQLYNACSTDTVGYSAGSIVTNDPNDSTKNTFASSNAYYVEAGPGTLPTAGRNTLPINPINNIDLTAYKSFSFRERYKFTVGAQAFNVLNHAQYLPGAVNNVYATSYTSSYNFQTVSNGLFNQPDKQFNNNARTMQLTAKFAF